MKCRDLFVAVLSLASLNILSGCQDNETLSSADEGTGYLAVHGVSVDISTTDGVAITRATGTFSAPDASELTYTLVNIDTGTETSYDSDDLSESLPLVVGNYTLKITYGEETMGITPYMYSATDFVIQDDVTTTLENITVGLGCAIICPQLTDDLLEQYESSYTLTISDGATTNLITNETDYFVPAGKDYTLTFSGTNLIGESQQFSVSIENVVAKTRYNLICDSSLPVFVLPTQDEGDVWSKSIYITAMTSEDITDLNGADEETILSNVVYEASSDGGTTWIAAETVNGQLVITGLEPSTTYTLRARIGTTVSTNTQEVTTESAQELENGDMEEWSSESYTTYGVQTIYLYYVGTSSTDKSWGTRNTLTMEGVDDGSSAWINNQRVAYRWNSGTIEASDAVSGSAAEIRTMAFANFDINRGTGILHSRSDMAEEVLADATVYAGYLYTGKTDVTSSSPEPDPLGIAHTARPESLTFSYKYTPYSDDNCQIYAKLYDANENEIAETEVFTSSNAVDDYSELTLTFEYSDVKTKAASLFIMFQSGVHEDTDYVEHVEGSYSANPWSLDTFVGSILYIDDVELNYE